ncbi:hypothetical protein TNCV_3729181, partial [Trichonephila clavipes]
PVCGKKVHAATLARRNTMTVGVVKLPDDWAYHHHLPQYSSSNPPAAPIQIAIVP